VPKGARTKSFIFLMSREVDLSGHVLGIYTDGSLEIKSLWRSSM